MAKILSYDDDDGGGGPDGNRTAAPASRTGTRTGYQVTASSASAMPQP